MKTNQKRWRPCAYPSQFAARWRGAAPRLFGWMVSASGALLLVLSGPQPCGAQAEAVLSLVKTNPDSEFTLRFPPGLTLPYSGTVTFPADLSFVLVPRPASSPATEYRPATVPIPPVAAATPAGIAPELMSELPGSEQTAARNVVNTLSQTDRAKALVALDESLVINPGPGVVVERTAAPKAEVATYPSSAPGGAHEIQVTWPLLISAPVYRGHLTQLMNVHLKPPREPAGVFDTMLALDNTAAPGGGTQDNFGLFPNVSDPQLSTLEGPGLHIAMGGLIDNRGSHGLIAALGTWKEPPDDSPAPAPGPTGGSTPPPDTGTSGGGGGIHTDVLAPGGGTGGAPGGKTGASAGSQGPGGANQEPSSWRSLDRVGVIFGRSSDGPAQTILGAAYRITSRIYLCGGPGFSTANGNLRVSPTFGLALRIGSILNSKTVQQQPAPAAATTDDTKSSVHPALPPGL